ncbi:TolC family protein [Botrimarina mediterranea]|uniref:TolC family protein n=1 Tax=Botrimarina mediterranea TaxID=2528022 RepID=UPI00118B8AB3|nr:Cobalt-zinc-cadmium resistance protein CzcC precursor [Planctomycetes bacterium K2D]
MTSQSIVVLLVAIAALGCATTPPGPVVELSGKSAPPESEVARVSYDEEPPTDLSQPAELGGAIVKPIEAVPAEIANDGLAIEAAIAMALASSPAVRQAEARVQALQGKWVQVGLPPNPTAGYLASEVGAEGSAGQQGGYAGQTFITAGKRQKSRAVVSAEVARAEQELASVTQRVRSDVRLRYYEALLAQRRVELAHRLVEFTSEAAEASKTLVEAAELGTPGLLQTEILQRNAVVLRTTSANDSERALRQLSNLLGTEGSESWRLQGEVEQLPALPNYETLLLRIRTESPEMAAAVAELERSRRAVTLAEAQALPNLSTQVSVQQEALSGDTLTGVQIGAPIPIWNRNQGGIRQSQANVALAARNIDRVERDLARRLADAFQRYSSAKATAAMYATDIVPKSQETLDLVRQAYQQGESGYLDLLTAQQTYTQTNLAYLDSLGETWQSYVLIDGLLLEGSLQEGTN